MTSIPPKVKVPTIPVVVKKGKTISLLKNNLQKNDLLLRCIKLASTTKDEVIYKSSPDDFLRGEFPSLTLISRLNVLTKTRTTIARFVSKESGKYKLIEKNSHDLIKLIGQKNFDTVFSAISSVISQELRIRAILALLTAGKTEDITRQKSYTDCACQTDETSHNLLNNFKLRKKVRRPQFRPYIVKVDDEQKRVKKIVIDPKAILYNTKVNNNLNVNSQGDTNTKISSVVPNRSVLKDVPKPTNVTETESLPELSEIINEDSNFSDISIGNVSLTSQHSVNIPQWVENPKWLLENVDQHIEVPNTVPLTLLDGSVIMVCAKPMDKFHWATSDMFRNLSQIDLCKLIMQQTLIDWKYCMEEDENGYLPIHQAVMTNDLDFLKRQCAALKKKHGSVDMPAPGNVTPLQMSVYPNGEACTALLLAHGADPLRQDGEGRTVVHAAADVSTDHLAAALRHCRLHAREILMDEEDLWRLEMERLSDEALAQILLDHICVMCDINGYTPLMLASRRGAHGAARLLAAASPDTVNRQAPTCGSTALYLAVAAAGVHAADSSNRSKISDDYMKTIEVLVESGGDPTLENHAGSSVNILLTEFNIVELSVLIANKLTSIKYFNGKAFDINSLMLVRNGDGKVGVKEIRSKKGVHDNKDSVGEGNVNSGNGESEISDVAEDRVNIKEEVIHIDSTDVNDDIMVVKLKASSFLKPPQPADVNGQSAKNAKAPKYVKILPKPDGCRVDTVKQGTAAGAVTQKGRKRSVVANASGATARKQKKKTAGKTSAIKKKLIVKV